MIASLLQILGGRGASAFERGAEKTIRDLLGGNSGRKPQVIDASQYGGLKNAEAAIRNLKRERLLVYEDIAQSPLSAYQGDKHSVSFNPEGVGNTSTVTHNHPDKRFGGTFSYADMGNATSLGLKSHRAAAREGTYYLRATPKARQMAFNRRIAKDIPMLEKRMRRVGDKIKKQAEKGSITWEKADAMKRTKMVGVLHKYYKQTAPQYGYVYGRQKLNKTRR